MAEVLTTTVAYGEHVVFFDNEVKGFAFSDVSGSTFSGLQVIPQTTMSQHQLPSILAAVFQIFPAQKFKAARNYDRSVKALMAKNPGLSFKQAVAKGDKEILKLKSLAEAEASDNELEFGRRKGDAVLYGQAVQLYHLATKKFLRISTIETSWTETSHLRVDLSETIERRSFFRMMPRFKLRTEGDPVRVNDQIVIESLESSEQYLHTSSTPLGDLHPRTKSHEVNLSVKKSAFVVHLHASVKDLESANSLQGGSIIQLHHKEMSAFLAAEGGFKSNPTIGVHLRIRAPDASRPSRTQPPTSAVSYWQVEIDESPLSGRVIEWNQRIRLRHVTTRRYLALVEHLPHEFSYDLLVDGNTPQCIFRFTPVLKEHSTIKFGAFSRIQHVVSGFWLHGSKSQPLLRVDHRQQLAQFANTEFARNVTKIVWDEAQLRKITPMDSPEFEDAFQVLKVPDERVFESTYVSGCSSYLHKYLQVRPTQPLTNFQAFLYLQALEELKNFMLIDGIEVKTRQKLLRNHGTIDLLISMLQVPFSDYSTVANKALVKTSEVDQPQHTTTKSVCTAVLKVLEIFMRGESRKSDCFIAMYAPFFMTLLGSPLQVEKMVIELIRDNDEIIDSIGEEEIDHIILELLKKRGNHNPLFLDILSVLCVCENSAKIGHQNRILKTLLEDKRAAGLMYHTKLTEEGVLLSVTGAKDTWVSLREFSKSGVSEDPEVDSSREFQYFCAQISLYGNLSLERNERAIKVITEDLNHMSWATSFHCLKDSHLPQSLRRRICDSISSLFVDVGANVNILAEVKLCWAWDEVSNLTESGQALQFPSCTSITGAKLPFFNELFDWIIEFIQEENAKVYASKRETNNLLASILKLIDHLVTFGYVFSPPVVSRIVPILVELLNGVDDLESEVAVNSLDHAGDEIDEHETVKRRKGNRATETKGSLWKTHGRFEMTSDNKTIFNVKFMTMRVIDSLLNLVMGHRLNYLLRDFKQAISLESIFADSDLNRSGYVRPKTPSTLDVSMLRTMAQSTDPKEVLALRPSVMKYLERLIAQTDLILQGERLDKPREENNTSSIVETLLDVAKYQSLRLLTSSFVLLNRLFCRVDTLFSLAERSRLLFDRESAALMKTLFAYLPQIRLIAVGRIEALEVPHFVKMLHELTDACYLDAAVDVKEPHQLNQKIINSTEIVSIVLDMVTSTRQPSDALIAGFKLLKALTKDYGKVKRRLFDNLDRILEAKGLETGWENSMANLVAEIFHNDRELCIEIRQPQLEKIMEFVTQHTFTASKMLPALSSITIIEELGVNLVRNQHLVVKLMMANPAMYECVHIGGVQDEKQRMAFLTSSSEWDRKRRQYHFRIVSLLAACAKGTNPYVEALCQNLIPLNDVISVLAHPDIDMTGKAAYLMYLAEVFMNTEISRIQSGTDLLHQNKSFWSALSGLAQQLSVLGTSCVPLNEEEEAFVFVGVVPALKMTLEYFYQPELYVESQSIMSQVFMQGCAFVRRVLSITSFHNIKLICSLIHHFKRFMEVPAELTNDLRRYFSTSESDIVVYTPAMAEYNEKYKKQNEIDSRLRKFIRNMRFAYQGHNIVGEQLQILKVPSSVVNDLYCESEDEDESLPLGPEFQWQVNLFVQFDPSTQSGDSWVAEGIHPDIANVVRFVKTVHSVSRKVSAQDRADHEETLTRLFQVFRAILHNQRVLQKDIVPYQHALSTAGFILPVTLHFSSADEFLPKEAIALFVIMLSGGNKVVQQELLTYMKGTRTEAFFVDVSRRLKDGMETIAETRILQKQIDKEIKQQAIITGTLTMAGTFGSQLNAAAQAGIAPVVKPSAQNLVTFKDTENIELVLQMLQQMCEGHYNDMQEYLREQPDNLRSIDLVTLSVDVLNLVITDINDKSLSLVIQTLGTLIDGVQGCIPNQIAVSDAKGIDAINFVVRRHQYPGCKASEVASLKYNCAVLVTSLLEDDSDPRTKNLAREIAESLDTSAIKRGLVYYYELHLAKGDVSWKNEVEYGENLVRARDVAFEYFTVLLRLESLDGGVFEASDTEIRGFEAAAEFYKSNTLTIELLRDDHLLKVHFFNRYGDCLREEMKESMKWNVDRSSPGDKISDFVQRSRNIIADIHYEKTLENSNPVLKFMLNHDDWWGIAALLITFAINILMMVTWVANEDNTIAKPIFDVSDYFVIFYPLAGAHLFMSTVMFLCHFLYYPPSLQALIEGTRFEWWADRILPFQWKSDVPRTRLSLFSGASVYQIAFLVFSILGLLYDGYFFCFHLFHIVVGNQILIRVLRAVTEQGKALLWLAALMTIIIYIYSLSAFAVLRRDFSADHNLLFCATPWQCFISSLRAGLLAGGGIGDNSVPDSYDTFTEFALRAVFFDISFFIIISTIALNLVFGVILDSFSSLRDDKFHTEELMRSECFICSIRGFEFDRAGSGFLPHIRDDHYMWNYLYFMMHVNQKKVSEWTVQERYFAECLRDGQEQKCFPINHSLVLAQFQVKKVEDRELLLQIIRRLDQQEEVRKEELKRLEEMSWESNRKFNAPSDAQMSERAAVVKVKATLAAPSPSPKKKGESSS